MDYFEQIDLNIWPRAEVYQLYTQQWTTVTYSVTKKLSASALVPYLKERGSKFVPAMLWLVSHEINRIENFRLAVRDHRIGTWNVIHPYFPVKNSTENMSFHAVRYRENFKDFYQDYRAEQQENAHKINLWATPVPENAFMISVMPWLHFDGMSMQLKNPKEYYPPYVGIGQYNEQMELPCVIMVNHATVDAWHLAQFFDGLQRLMNTPELWCE